MKAWKAVLPAMLLVSGLALAQSPLAGTWKFNPSRSQLTGGTLQFASADAGGIRLTTGGQSYTFRTDGSDTTTPFGATANWTQIDAHTWQAVVKRGAVNLETDVYRLADDGKTLLASYTGTKPNGDSFHDTEVFHRAAGSDGFLGTWKSEKVSVSSPGGYEIKDNGDGSITWSLPDYHATVTLKLDGNDYTAVGPTVPEQLTLSLTPSGPRSFELVEKLKGKAIYKSKMTVSEDGRTLTDQGSAVGVDEPTTSVYDKI